MIFSFIFIYCRIVKLIISDSSSLCSRNYSKSWFTPVLAPSIVALPFSRRMRSWTQLMLKSTLKVVDCRLLMRARRLVLVAHATIGLLIPSRRLLRHLELNSGFMSGTSVAELTLMVALPPSPTLKMSSRSILHLRHWRWAHEVCLGKEVGNIIDFIIFPTRLIVIIAQ